MAFVAILYSDRETFGAEELASKLDISTMTVLRASDELKKMGIVSCEIDGQTGRKNVYNIGSLTINEYVDPTTLIQTLEEIDDRIEIAIDELMGGGRIYRFYSKSNDWISVTL